MAECAVMGANNGTLGWYLAEVVMEIAVEDDRRKVVHQNLTLVSANSAEEAYEKALAIGRDAESSYDNPAGKRVQIIFRGISDLDQIHEELEDGAEIDFRERIDVSEDEIVALIPARHKLRVFQPPQRSKGPDYASGEIVAEVERKFGIRRPD